MKDKALEYIEKLCLVWDNGNKQDVEITNSIIHQIYKFSHCVQDSHGCHSVHEDWREELRNQNWEI